ncbi:MAG TPA: hypothetical protein VFV07_01200 [Rhizomicrobium sp.]|nr:hypothetical protein [Rhizomicrobium sp.]
MKKIAAAAICMVMLTASGRLPEIVQAPAAMDAYQGQPLTIVVQKKATFVATTSGRAAFALLGALASMSAGDQLVKDNDIADPSVMIADGLASDLASRFKTAPPTTIHDFDSDAEADIAKAAGGKGLALYVETTGWGFGYYAFKWGRYHVGFSMHARLIDAATGAVIAQAPCKHAFNDEDHAPDYDAMMADQAAFIKKTFADGASACVAELEGKMLGTAQAAPAPQP